ncbi:MAG: EFR1 family ferrodoxin [Spirochaetota bacterium]|nr:EFR1 family ferrodoxin [Spirochaetota bacterium]
MSGSATFIITLILTIKGYKVRGLKSVDMPSNWFILHPIQGLESQKAIIKRSETNVANFATTILSGNSVLFTLNNIYELIMGAVLFQISIGYLLIGRFSFAKLIFANENCNGCEICKKNCFVNAIKLHGKTKKMPFWKYNCESCMRCASLCP